jgi:hypothetical protein
MRVRHHKAEISPDNLTLTLDLALSNAISKSKEERMQTDDVATYVTQRVPSALNKRYSLCIACRYAGCPSR